MFFGRQNRVLKVIDKHSQISFNQFATVAVNLAAGDQRSFAIG
jgi:hypothetical protein